MWFFNTEPTLGSSKEMEGGRQIESLNRSNQISISFRGLAPLHFQTLPFTTDSLTGRHILDLFIWFPFLLFLLVCLFLLWNWKLPHLPCLPLYLEFRLESSFQPACGLLLSSQLKPWFATDSTALRPSRTFHSAHSVLVGAAMRGCIADTTSNSNGQWHGWPRAEEEWGLKCSNPHAHPLVGGYAHDISHLHLGQLSRGPSSWARGWRGSIPQPHPRNLGQMRNCGYAGEAGKHTITNRRQRKRYKYTYINVSPVATSLTCELLPKLCLLPHY